MSATIIILPVIALPTAWGKDESQAMVRVPLPKKHANRLFRLSRDWNMSPEEAAAAIIDQYFRSVRDR